MRYADTRPERSRNTQPGDGRLAQRESASFTPRRSLVRSQYRPRAGLCWSVAFGHLPRGPQCFPGARAPGPPRHGPAHAGRWPLVTFRAGRTAFPGARAPGPPTAPVAVRGSSKPCRGPRGTRQVTAHGLLASWLVHRRSASPGCPAVTWLRPSRFGTTVVIPRCWREIDRNL